MTSYAEVTVKDKGIGRIDRSRVEELMDDGFEGRAEKGREAVSCC